MVKLVTEKRGRHKEKEAEHDRMTNYMDYLVMDTSYTTPEQKKRIMKICVLTLRLIFLKRKLLCIFQYHLIIMYDNGYVTD